MNKVLLCLVLIVVSNESFGQFVLARQTLSCFSVQACDELCIHSTAGQIDFGTMTNATTIFTSGFEQTEGAQNLYVNLSLIRDECSQTFRAEISQVFGCSDADSIFIYWNNALCDSVTQLATTLNVLRVETSTGCIFEKVYDFQLLDVFTEPCGLEFFNYCSPNGDGDNDEWVINNIRSPSYAVNELTIVNRWGGEVWHGVNYNNDDVCWKGETQEGNPLPNGTYFYALKVGKADYTGYIELLR